MIINKRLSGHYYIRKRPLLGGFTIMIYEEYDVIPNPGELGHHLSDIKDERAHWRKAKMEDLVELGIDSNTGF